MEDNISKKIKWTLNFLNSEIPWEMVVNGENKNFPVKPNKAGEACLLWREKIKWEEPNVLSVTDSPCLKKWRKNINKNLTMFEINIFNQPKRLNPTIFTMKKLRPEIIEFIKNNNKFHFLYIFYLSSNSFGIPLPNFIFVRN